MQGPSPVNPKGRPRGPAGVRTSYQVDTKGMCFLCLRRRQRCSNKKQSEEISSQFCKILMRYLKLDFYQNVVKPSKFKWKANKVKKVCVEMCQDCSLMAATFNRLYCEAELIQMKMNAYVKTISDIMRVAGRIPSRVKAYQERMGIGTKEQEAVPATMKPPLITSKPALLVQNFRKELIQRTFDSYKRAVPRVILKRTTGTVSGNQLRTSGTEKPTSSKNAVAILKTPLSPIQMKFRSFLLAYTVSFATVWLLSIQNGGGKGTAFLAHQGTKSAIVEDESTTQPEASSSTMSANNTCNQATNGQPSDNQKETRRNSIMITDSGNTVMLPHQSFKIDDGFVDESIMEYEDNADLIDLSEDGFFAEANALVNDVNMSASTSNNQLEPMEMEQTVKQEPQESPLEVNDRTCTDCRIHLSCRAELEKHRLVIHNFLSYVQCPICKSMFSGYHFLKKHRKESETCALDEATEALEFTTIAKPLFPYSSTVRGSRFCPMEGCFEVFLKHENLQLHLKAHGTFNCKQGTCKETFDKAHDLALHESKQHSGNQSSGYKCARCDFHVGGQYQYILHFLGEHMNINVFSEQCNICRKGFISKTNIANDKEVHFRTHHDIKGKDPKSVIKCDVDNCEAFFLKKQQLTAHKTHIHHIEQEAQFTCSICGVKVLNQNVMFRHKLEAHSNLPAHEIQAQIKRRMRTRAPNKGKYKCVYCLDQFTTKYSLLIHGKVHDHLKNSAVLNEREEETAEEESRPESLKGDNTPTSSNKETKVGELKD